MGDGTAVVEAADVEVTELKLGDHVARGQTGLAAQLLCSSCAVFHELACHQALTTQLSKAVDRERPLVADTRPRIHLMAVNTSAVFRPYRNSVQALPASAGGFVPMTAIHTARV